MAPKKGIYIFSEASTSWLIGICKKNYKERHFCAILRGCLKIKFLHFPGVLDCLLCGVPYTKQGSGLKKSNLGHFLMRKWPTKWLLRLYKWKKNCSDLGVHGTQIERLRLTVPTQKSVLKNMHRVPRYRQKCVKFWWFGLECRFWTVFS